MLHHVALELEPADLPAAREFWGLVGFREVTPPGGLAQRSIWLERTEGGTATQIHLILGERPDVPRVGHAAIVVPDYDSTVAKLRGHGYEVEDRRPHWGSSRAFARHPGGHTVELMAAPPPPASSSRPAARR